MKLAHVPIFLVKMIMQIKSEKMKIKSYLLYSTTRDMIEINVNPLSMLVEHDARYRYQQDEPGILGSDVKNSFSREIHIVIVRKFP